MLEQRSKPTTAIEVRTGRSLQDERHLRIIYSHGADLPFGLFARTDEDVKHDLPGELIAVALRGRLLSAYAFDNGASAVRHDYDLKLDE